MTLPATTSRASHTLHTKPATDTKPSLGLVLCGVAIATLAFILYLPLRPRPFDILDFSEFLPILTSHGSLLERFDALLHYYLRDQGRLNVLPYVFLMLKWELLGDRVVLWQLLRFAQMLVIAAGIFRLCRSFGASRSASGWAATLLVTAGSSSSAWVRLTMGEPLGLLFLLAALWAVERLSDDRPGNRRVIVAVVALGCMVLCKETLAAAVPFVLGVAWCRQPDGSFAWSQRPSPQKVGLIAATLTVMIGLGVIIAVIVANAHKEAFASLYGRNPLSLGMPLLLATLLLLPSWPRLYPEDVVLPVNLAFLVLVGLGWALRLRAETTRTSAPVLLGLILLLPSLAAVAYSPWPQFEHFYGLPFLIAPALLLALAATALQKGGVGPKYLAHLSCFGIVLLTGIQALYLSREATARQEINYHLAMALAALGPNDSAFVALKSTYPESWRGPGPALMRYGGVVARRADMPTVVNVACEAIPSLLGSPQTNARRSLISYTSICGELPKPSQSIRRSFTFIDLGSPLIRRVTMGADVMTLGGAPGSSP